MKILVFDDSPNHRLTAKLTLKDHEVRIVGTYDEAKEALTARHDYELCKRIAAELLPQAGFKPDDTDWDIKNDPERKALCREIWDKASEQATTYPDFDVVLLDLMVPASKAAMGQDGMQFVGKERELGAILALRALRAGIKNVAVVTDMNHHNHPAAAAFDGFGRSKCEGFNLLCTNRPEFVQMDAATDELVSVEFLESDAGKAKYPSWEGIKTGKDWGDILKQLVPEA